MKDFQIHDQENNSESQEHLQENHKHFSKQCLKVWELLRQGVKLTTVNSPSYGVLSLPRRILDLKENGIHINDEWLRDDKGKKTIKQWFILKKIERQPTKSGTVDWWARFLKGEFDTDRPALIQQSLF